VRLSRPALAQRRAPRWVRALHDGPLHLAIVAVSLLWMVPSLGLLVSSFRPADQVATTGWWTAFSTPFAFTLENYEQVLSARNMGQSFVNSLSIAVPTTVIVILVAAFAAYALAWMPFPGRDLLFVALVCLLIVPLQMVLVPVLRLFNAIW
jgi:alpha-glucoside transport system permease protein